MAKVLMCSQFNDSTQQCEVQQWVDQTDWTTPLPDIEQAAMVGGAYFIGLMTLAVVRGLLNPKSIEE
ncbi:hypothetical protein [Stenotrophomonas sp.]|uniref:hypothetical protein n=1 Tax=Stenotrophomonas sp. TaxID=69392 RepID=UPI002896BCB2|nr:hypothetical protein [Stenotrophomonas sp.]